MDIRRHNKHPHLYRGAIPVARRHPVIKSPRDRGTLHGPTIFGNILLNEALLLIFHTQDRS